MKILFLIFLNLRFLNLLNETDWSNIYEINTANDSFLKRFSDCYEIEFLKTEIKTKRKNLLSPWITK